MQRAEDFGETLQIGVKRRGRVGRSKLSVVRDGYVFLQSIVWTALAYNPVSILGKLGLVGVGLAALAGLWLVGLRLTGSHWCAPAGDFCSHQS